MIRVERVEVVGLGDDQQRAVGEERLGVDLAVQDPASRKSCPKSGAETLAGREGGLGGVPAGAEVIGARADAQRGLLPGHRRRDGPLPPGTADPQAHSTTQPRRPAASTHARRGTPPLLAEGAPWKCEDGKGAAGRRQSGKETERLGPRGVAVQWASGAVHGRSLCSARPVPVGGARRVRAAWTGGDAGACRCARCRGARRGAGGRAGRVHLPLRRGALVLLDRPAGLHELPHHAGRVRLLAAQPAPRGGHLRDSAICRTPSCRRCWAKAEHGWNHSKAFTLQDFHEPIQIGARSARLVQDNCLACHGEHGVGAGARQHHRPGRGALRPLPPRRRSRREELRGHRRMEPTAPEALADAAWGWQWWRRWSRRASPRSW